MTNKLKTEIGERIKILWKASELTWSDFAKKVKIPLQTLRHYQTGQNYPSPKNLLSISKFCRVSIDWILTGEEFSPALNGRQTLARSAALNSLDRIPIYFIRWVGWDIEKTAKKVSTKTLVQMEHHLMVALKLLRIEIKK